MRGCILLPSKPSDFVILIREQHAATPLWPWDFLTTKDPDYTKQSWVGRCVIISGLRNLNPHSEVGTTKHTKYTKLPMKISIYPVTKKWLGGICLIR
jgi:hypothetical protein